MEADPSGLYAKLAGINANDTRMIHECHKSTCAAILPENSLPEMPFELFAMPNGIRVVHQFDSRPVAYCALFIRAGSRDELAHEQGAAHLIEHLLFKETKKRKAHHILSRMEDVGGEINAYTAKEETCIHAAFLSDDYERALELIGDLVFNQNLTEKNIELEKKVVFDEIKSYQDAPSELIFDDFDKLLMGNHPLGNNTLGSIPLVKKLNRPVLEQFVARNYSTDQMVISSVGNIPLKKLTHCIEKYFGHIAIKKRNLSYHKPEIQPLFTIRANKKNHQSHCVIGCQCGQTGNRRFRLSMALLSNLLAGQGMHTRLGMSLRERYGWVYHVEASYTPYSDSGIFNIYFATGKNNLEKCIRQIEKELDQLKEKALTDIQLKKLKQQTIGQLAIACDSGDARMLSAGKHLLMFDRVDPLPEICSCTRQITPEYLRDVANQVFSQLSLLAYVS